MRSPPLRRSFSLAATQFGYLLLLLSLHRQFLLLPLAFFGRSSHAGLSSGIKSVLPILKLSLSKETFLASQQDVVQPRVLAASDTQGNQKPLFSKPDNEPVYSVRQQISELRVRPSSRRRSLNAVIPLSSVLPIQPFFHLIPQK